MDKRVLILVTETGWYWYWHEDGRLWDVMAQYPRRQPSSYSPPWEPEISPDISMYCMCRMHSSCIWIWLLQQLQFSVLAVLAVAMPTPHSLARTWSDRQIDGVFPMHHIYEITVIEGNTPSSTLLHEYKFPWFEWWMTWREGKQQNPQRGFQEPSSDWPSPDSALIWYKTSLPIMWPKATPERHKKIRDTKT
jgi:hypothetical protein